MNPREAWANLPAMRAEGEAPRDDLGWATSDLDGADSLEWRDFELELPTTPHLAKEVDADLGAVQFGIRLRHRTAGYNRCDERYRGGNRRTVDSGCCSG